MKRLLIMLVAMLGVIGWVQAVPPPKRPRPVTKRPTRPRKKGAAAVKIAEPTVVREIAPEKVTAGMRVKLHFKRGRPFVGFVLRVSDTHVDLDLSTESTGLPATFKFRRKDVVKAYELTKQSQAEREAVRAQQSQQIRGIVMETREEYARRKAGVQADARKRAELRKALDVVVAEDKEKKMRALLEEFPPEQWGEARFNEIRDNWWLRDLRPSDKERRFTTVFKEWKTARETIRALDAQQDVEKGTQLLLRFPPSVWDHKRLEAIVAKETKGGALTADESDFRKNYETWARAVRRRGLETAGETPADRSTEERPADAEPVEIKGAEKRPADEKPAEEKPTEEKPAKEDTDVKDDVEEKPVEDK